MPCQRNGLTWELTYPVSTGSRVSGENPNTMTTDTRSAQKAEKGSRNTTPWLILIVLLLFSIAAPLNQFKVPPIIPVLMTSLGLSVSGAGMLMSVYAVTGLILAIPSGFILQRAGFRITGLIAGGSIVIGSVLGALSATTGTLLVSRVRSRARARVSWLFWPLRSSLSGSSQPGAARPWASGQPGCPSALP